MSDDMSHQLTILIDAPLIIAVEKSGSYAYPAGTYVTTGSAKRNIDARISRHLRCNKTLRWHIDYLLHATGVAISKIERFVEPECVLNQRTPGKVLIDGFGTSDCMSGCGSHLKYQDKQDHIL